jgi:hypothetical protein
MPWSYEARLRAVGRLVDAAQLSSVCVTEFEEGFLVLGMGLTEQVGGVEASERSLEYSFAEVDALCATIEGE